MTAINEPRRLRHSGALYASVLIAVLLISAAPIFSQKLSGEAGQMFRRGVRLTRAGDLVEAEKMLRAALAASPASPEVKTELAYNLSKQRRLLSAFDLIKGVVEADPNNSRAVAVLGMVFLNAGRFADARVVFNKAVELNKNEDLAYFGHGLMQFYENRIVNGLYDLRVAVWRNSQEPDYYFALGQVASRAEQYKEAAEAYRGFLAVSSNTDRDRRARITGLIAFLEYLGGREVLYRVVGESSATVPFDLIGDRPIINVRVNGAERPLRFVLDTGSGISVMSDEAAKMMKIREVARGGHAKGIGGDGKFEIVYGFVRQFAIGDVTIRNVPIYIRKFHPTGTPVDGYIGLSLISKFLTTVDYGTKTFALRRKDDEETPAPAPLTDGSSELPLRLTSSGFLSGEVSLDGFEDRLNFIVDTGASISVISDQFAQTDPIKNFISDERHRVVGSAGITDDVRSYRLPRLTFGPNTRTDVLAIALDLDLINEASGFEQAGILGGNFLKNYKLTFDFKNSRVTFTPVGSKE